MSTIYSIIEKKNVKEYNVILKPIYLDINTLFIFYPDFSILNYFFSCPIKAKVYVSNNGVEYSQNFLSFEILAFPRIDTVLPRLYIIKF